MVRKINKISGQIRYVVFETGAINPKKITRLSLADAKKIANKILKTTKRKGRNVTIQKVQTIFEE